MNWGKEIKTRRIKKGLSVADLSLKSEVKDMTIRKIENGQKLGGSINMVDQILRGLGSKLTIQDDVEEE